MKVRTITFVFLVTYLSIFTSALFAQPLVTVQHQTNTFHFKQAPRLADVLAKLNNKTNVYWPAATMFQLPSNKIKQIKLALLKNLETLHTEIDYPHTNQSIKHLQQQINSWQYAKRLALNIDYDLARTVIAQNPQLTKGHYLLSAQSRSKVIYLFGAINDKTKHVLPHQNQQFASDYIKSEWLSPIADPNFLTLIQANGQVISIPTSDWEKKRIEVMPGSHLLVPFKQSLLGPKVAHINQQLISLAVNRVQ